MVAYFKIRVCFETGGFGVRQIGLWGQPDNAMRNAGSLKNPTVIDSPGFYQVRLDFKGDSGYEPVPNRHGIISSLSKRFSESIPEEAETSLNF
jgi:hypothetical protein